MTAALILFAGQLGGCEHMSAITKALDSYTPVSISIHKYSHIRVIIDMNWFATTVITENTNDSQ